MPIVLPTVVINLIGEMFYILDQRLRSQGINQERSAVILHELAQACFDDSFMDQIFQCPVVPSMPALRSLIFAMVSCTSMRLSEDSTLKLYDLMVMGVKYQIVCSTHHDSISRVTLRHLDTVADILRDEDATLRIHSVRARVAALMARWTPGEMLAARRQIFRFFQDKNVKVSLFLAEGIQAPDAKIFLPAPTAASPATPVGHWTTYDARGDVRGVGVSSGRGAHPTDGHLGRADLWFAHPEPLGANLYAADRAPVPLASLPTYLYSPAPTSTAAAVAATSATPAVSAPLGNPPPAAPAAPAGPAAPAPPASPSPAASEVAAESLSGESRPTASAASPPSYARPWPRVSPQQDALRRMLGVAQGPDPGLGDGGAEARSAGAASGYKLRLDNLFEGADQLRMEDHSGARIRREEGQWAASNAARGRAEVDGQRQQRAYRDRLERMRIEDGDAIDSDPGRGGRGEKSGAAGDHEGEDLLALLDGG